jgi:hypothetical protein
MDTRQQNNPAYNLVESLARQYLILPFAVNLDITFRIGIIVFVDGKVAQGLRYHRVIRRVIRLININISICIILAATESHMSCGSMSK